METERLYTFIEIFNKFFFRKEKNVKESERNANSAIVKENQIDSLISSMVKKLGDLPRSLNDNLKNGHQEQEAVNEILEEERSELRKKQERNELTVQRFDDENKIIGTSIRAMKDKILEIAEVLSGKLITIYKIEQQ